MGNPSPPPPATSGERRRLDPKRSSRDRVLLLGMGALVCAVIWLGIVLALPPLVGVVVQATTPLWVGFIAGLLWAGYTLLTAVDEPFFARLAAAGAGAALAWAIGTGGLILMGVTPLIAGWLSMALVWFVAQTMPVWVVEIEPGEVLYFRPITHRQYKYELVSCPVQRIEPSLQPNARGARTRMASILQFMDAASAHQVAHVELAIDHLWVRPVDELRLLWKMEKNIVVETQIRDIVTRDQSAFTLWLKIGATLDPTQIRGRTFLLQIPKIESPAKLEATMKAIIQDNVDKAAREYFITRTAGDARGAAGVMGFRSQVAALLVSLSDNLGLTFVESMINSTPVLSQEQRTAADRAAAAPEAARADLATTDALIERAMSGSAPHQLYLYTRIVEKGAQFRALPPVEQMPQMNPVDQFLWRVTRNDPPSLELLRAMAAAYPQLPVPPALAPYLAESASDASPALPAPLAVDLPPPAPARLRAPEPDPLDRTQPNPAMMGAVLPLDVTPNLPPAAVPALKSGVPPPPNLPDPFAPPPPDALPEAPPPLAPRSSAVRLRPHIDIPTTVQTRQRPDGSYEADFDEDDD
jgi:hypothetical protein